MKTMTPPITVTIREGQPVFLMSDLHIGTRDMDIRRLRLDIQMISETDGVVLINGDVFDMILPTDKRHEIDPHILDTRNHIINHHVDMAVELLKPIARQICMIGVGNHEYTVITRYHVDPVKLLINDLYRLVGANIVYGGYEGFVRLLCSDLRDKKERGCFFLYYHHGWGGSPKSGPRLALNDLRSYVIADVYWIGHKHQVDVSRVRRKVPHRHHVEYREELLVATGTYLTDVSDRRESYTPWSVRRGMAPPSSQAYVVLRVRDGQIVAEL